MGIYKNGRRLAQGGEHFYLIGISIRAANGDELQREEWMER